MKSERVAKGSAAKAPSAKARAKFPDNYWYAALLFVVAFAFMIRSILPWKNVFRGGEVLFSSESDAWYHMMLAKITALHLQRPWFDPLTFFPQGTTLHFGPFESWGIAILSLIAGLGKPSIHTIEVIGAFWPVILGTLLIIPVYFIGKELGGRSAGLIAAGLVAIMPGQLLQRTTLGFADHHSSEALLSTAAMLFFMLAVRYGREMTLASVMSRAPAIKKPLIFTILAGVFLGLYLDAWVMGILFEGILLIFLALQVNIDHLRGRSTEYLGVIFTIAFLIAMILILPFAHVYAGFSVISYSLFQPSMLLLGVAFALVTTLLSKTLSDKANKSEQAHPAGRWLFTGSIAGIIIAGFLVLRFALPGLFFAIYNGIFTYLFPRTGGASTVAELSPLLSVSAIQNNFPGLWGISPFFLALIGLGVLIYRYVKRPRAKELVFICWSIIIILITLAMNRSAYYCTVNLAILCGYLSQALLSLTKLSDLESALNERIKNPSLDLDKEFNLKDALVMAAATIVVIFLLVFPSMQVAVPELQYASGPNPDWMASLRWMQNNTPEPGLDIYNVYERPPTGQAFQYPPTAYGVMSWWDYGHMIETVGHRYPNANPFQQGIGNITADKPGSSPFFLAENESEAERVLTNLNKSRSPYLNARYIMTDVEMAVSKFHAMAAWSAIPYGKYVGIVVQDQGTGANVFQVYQEPFFRTMVERLHFFDGSEIDVTEAVAVAYESRNGIPYLAKAPKFSRNYSELLSFVNASREEGYYSSVVSQAPTTTPVPLEALHHYRLVHESPTNVTTSGVKYVKTFEHVPGAMITGSAAPGSKVMIAALLKTNMDRQFIYRQSNTTASDGTFILVVPYSTEGPIEGGTKFGTAPVMPYMMTVGTTQYQVRVPEELVMNGGVIKV